MILRDFDINDLSRGANRFSKPNTNTKMVG